MSGPNCNYLTAYFLHLKPDVVGSRFGQVVVLSSVLSACSTDNQLISLESTSLIAAKPLVTFAFGAVPADIDNIYPVAHLFRDPSESPATRQLEYDKIKNLRYKGLWAQNEGIITDHPGDRCAGGQFQCPWFDHAILDRVQYFRTMMNELRANNIQLDEILWDNEDWLSNWRICGNNISTPSLWVQAINNDPRFSLWNSLLPMPNLNNICNFLTSWDYSIWNGFIEDWMGTYHQQIIDAIETAQPGIEMSDWQRFKHGADEPLDPNCVIPAYRLTSGQIGHGWNYGSKGQFVVYGYTLATRCRDPSQGLTFDYPQDPLHNLIYELNLIIAGKRAGTGKFNVVIAYQSWDSFSEFGWHFPYAKDQWYREMLYHIYLIGTDRLLYWNPVPPWGTTTEGQQRFLSQIIKEADRYLGYEDRESLTNELIPWNSTQLKTCSKANGRKVCRTTQMNGTGAWSFED